MVIYSTNLKHDTSIDKGEACSLQSGVLTIERMCSAWSVTKKQMVLVAYPKYRMFRVSSNFTNLISFTYLSFPYY